MGLEVVALQAVFHQWLLRFPDGQDVPAGYAAKAAEWSDPGRWQKALETRNRNQSKAAEGATLLSGGLARRLLDRLDRENARGHMGEEVLSLTYEHVDLPAVVAALTVERTRPAALQWLSNHLMLLGLHDDGSQAIHCPGARQQWGASVPAAVTVDLLRGQDPRRPGTWFDRVFEEGFRSRYGCWMLRDALRRGLFRPRDLPAPAPRLEFPLFRAEYPGGAWVSYFPELESYDHPALAVVRDAGGEIQRLAPLVPCYPKARLFVHRAGERLVGECRAISFPKPENPPVPWQGKLGLERLGPAVRWREIGNGQRGGGGDPEPPPPPPPPPGPDRPGPVELVAEACDDVAARLTRLAHDLRGGSR